jgi:hypothetical protein
MVDGLRRRTAAAWLVVLVFIVLVGASGCGETENSSSSGSSAGAKPASGPGSSGNEPNKNASESNTPSVGPRESVEVDDLRWNLLHAEKTSTIGEASSGLGATANGIFVVVTLHVTNKKHSTATMTSDIVTLLANKKEYKTSSSADTALLGQGGKTFLIQELGPEVSLAGKAAFDVPPQILNESPQLRFNELGFGSTHGYIALPPL